jgi:hypothetical protein
MAIYNSNYPVKRILLLWLIVLWSSLAQAGVSAWIPFEIGNGHIRVPVTLNGEETWAILDSGATGNGISERFLASREGEYKFGRKVRVTGVLGERDVRLIDGIDIGIFGSKFTIGELMPVRTYSFDFIVGLPFFENYILQIDYPNSRLRIIGHDAFDLKPYANVKMRRIGGAGAPVVKARLNDQWSPWLLLDTGATGGIFIKRGDAERFDWLETFATEKGRVRGVNKVGGTERLNLPFMTIGPFTLESPIVTVQAEGETTNVGQELQMRLGSRLKKAESDGILGYDILKHFIVTMDFKRSLLHLEPPPE